MHECTHAHLLEAGWRLLEVLGVRDGEKVSLELRLEGRQKGGHFKLQSFQKPESPGDATFALFATACVGMKKSLPGQ